ncbi:MAG: DUF4116 domain-containing protein [Alphaproteobacteria bacterium]|nr:DUF4116 domain-containing protein [Alphaproteobacteria bacterium]MBU0860188.1 DUF4116 domain-containing protein [Alphaproteobacteria bacterium]
MTATPIRYGWCHTDHKPGRTIREDWLRPDYVTDPAWAPAVAGALARLGLPQPAPDHVFRGTNHDILFIDSHGVTVRIGPTDIADMIHPAILQPLGWVDDVTAADGRGISIVIYPGVELYEHAVNRTAKYTESTLEDILMKTGHRSDDVTVRNIGLIRLQRDAQDFAVPVVIDIDNEMTGSYEDFMGDKNREAMAQGIADGIKCPAIMQRLLESVSIIDPMMADLRAAFTVHQPLRHMFWDAFDSADSAKMNAFWERCAVLTSKPERVIRHEWTKRASSEGAPIWRKHEIKIDNLALYRPWTKQPEDMATKYTGAKALWPDYIARIVEDPAVLQSLPRHVARKKDFVALALAANPECADYVDPVLGEDQAFLEGLDVERSIRMRAAATGLRDDADFVFQAIWAKPEFYALASERLQNDREFGARCLSRNYKFAPFLPQEWLQDRDFVLDALKFSPEIYQFLSPELRRDEDVAKNAISRAGQMLAHAPENFCDRADFVEVALRSNFRSIRFASERLQKNFDMALKAISYGAEAYCDLHADLQADHGFKMRVLGRRGVALHYMDDSDRNNRELVLVAIQNDTDSFVWASEQLQADPLVVRSYLKESPGGARHLNSPLMADEDFMMGMLRQEILTFSQLPAALQERESFIRKACDEMGEDVRLLRHTLAHHQTFDELWKDVQKRVPVVEKDGLRYVWVQNVQEAQAKPEGANKVRVADRNLIVRDAVIGPARAGVAGQAGIYCLEKK